MGQEELGVKWVHCKYAFMLRKMNVLLYVLNDGFK